MKDCFITPQMSQNILVSSLHIYIYTYIYVYIVICSVLYCSSVQGTIFLHPSKLTNVLLDGDFRFNYNELCRSKRKISSRVLQKRHCCAISHIFGLPYLRVCPQIFCVLNILPNNNLSHASRRAAMINRTFENQ